MGSSSGFRCVVIGEGALAVDCAKLLLDRGHRIVGVMAADRDFESWARSENIPTGGRADDMAAFVGREEFDYLFSIINFRIIPAEVLAMPRRWAVNFHDAPLPRYAGMNAVPWALMNGEQTHAISWHLIVDEVDAGAILKQREIPVADRETALSLNVKCYEAGLAAFGELVPELERETAAPTEQNLAERTYFSRLDRPDRGGVLSFAADAVRIDATARALDFGPYRNRFGSAKVAIGDELYLVGSARPVSSKSGKAPGTILRCGDDGIAVATATRDVELGALRTLDGAPVTAASLVARHGLVAGDRLPCFDAEASARLASVDLATSRYEAFWVRRLSDVQPATIPASNSDRAAAPGPTATLAGSLPIEALAYVDRHDGVTASDLFLAAFGVYLSRTGERTAFDIWYSDGALASVAADAPGLVADRVPVRMRLDHSLTCAEAIDAVRVESKLVRDRGAYSADLAARYPHLQDVAGTGAGEITIEVAYGVAPRVRPSTLALVLPGEGRGYEWRYDASALDAGTVARIDSRLSTILESISVAPDGASIGDLTVMSAEERTEVVHRFNATDRAFDSGVCLHELFERQVDAHPDRVALVVGTEELSYGDLDARANRLARYLLSLGVEREQRVGVCLDRGTDLVVALLAVFKTGGAYVGLDPAYPRRRLDYIIADAQISVVVTAPAYADLVDASGARAVFLDAERDRIELEPATRPAAVASPDSLAYVIYTSGSTGEPKGVAIEHHSGVALAAWASDLYTDAELSGVLASTSVCFDLSVYELWVTLGLGGTVILAKDALALEHLDARDRVRLINTVPSAAAELVRSGAIPATVETINLAGEPLKPALVDALYDAGLRRVYDLYGPSETTTYSTGALRERGKPATIGRPLANEWIVIVDPSGRPVPIGVVGELLIGGEGVARGYLGRDEATRARFVPDEITGRGGRLYRTGDIGRWRADGQIEYLGRNDAQVKIRGFRIEMGEIEVALVAHAGVREAVVLAREERGGGLQLAGYWVAADETTTATDLKRYLGERLPAYMVPSALVKLDAIPLTPNGKVDKRALLAVVVERDVEDAFVAPRDEVERGLAEIWETTLGIERVGVHDNFFDLGGHSILTVRVFAEIDRVFGKNLPLATLFDAPTIEQLAKIIVAEGWTPSWSSLVAIKPEGTLPPLFCMHAGGGNVLFYRPLALRLDDDQPVYALQPQGLDGKQPRHNRVEDMAAHYIGEMRTVQPHGPYRLCGSSFGGLVALEIAQQLRAAGEETSLLLLFDTFGPGYPRMRPQATLLRNKLEGWAQRVGHHVTSVRGLEGEQRWEYISERAWKVRKTAIRWYLKRKKRVMGAVYRALGKSLPQALKETQNAITEAQRAYVPLPYDRPMTLLRAKHQPPGVYPDPSLGWDSIASVGLEIHEVPGYHGTTVAEPYVKVTVGIVRDCLERVNSAERDAASGLLASVEGEPETAGVGRGAGVN